MWTDKLTPSAFEKHSGRETARKWKNNVWIIVNGDKVPVVKTPLLKYYNKSLKHAISQNGKACHRDEFLRCTECNKARRFRLRSKEECRTYHDALANVHWNCSCIPYDKYVPLIQVVILFFIFWIHHPLIHACCGWFFPKCKIYLIDQSNKICILFTEWVLSMVAEVMEWKIVAFC